VEVLSEFRRRSDELEKKMVQKIKELKKKKTIQRYESKLLAEC